MWDIHSHVASRQFSADFHRFEDTFLLVFELVAYDEQ